MTTVEVPALYMRGGTSKGVFFRDTDIPSDAAARDRLLLRAMGSPDVFGTQMDGLGGGTSSTSKVMVVTGDGDARVSYSFGQVAVDRGFIDWSGTCGNLAAAIGVFALWRGLVRAPKSRAAHLLLVNRNNGSRVEAEIPVCNGKPVEEGEFELDGVAFPGAEIRLAFLTEESDDAEPVFATGSPTVVLDVPGVGEIPATLVRAGNPTVIVDAAALGLRGDEMQSRVNGDPALLDRLERIRSHAAVRLGMAATAEEASRERLQAPKIAWVAPASGLSKDDVGPEMKRTVDLRARTLSVGKLHHAIPGAAAVAIAMAAAVPGTVVERVLGGRRTEICIGHASGVMSVGAEAVCRSGRWTVTKAVMSRSARRLMDGMLMVPMDVPAGGMA
jgi:hypothetical protein